MRLSVCRNRWLRAAIIAAWVNAIGCQRLPYIDQSKPVPHDNLGRVALEDKEIKRADLLSATIPLQLPRLSKPRTTNDPEAQEIWPMTLQQSIRIGLDNSEIVRVIAFGAQGIPIGGFDPTPFATHRFELADTEEAYDTFADAASTNALKVVLIAQQAQLTARDTSEALAGTAV